MQKHVNLVDLVKSFPTNIFLQNLAAIQKRTSPLKFDHLAEKSENGSISNLSTKRGTTKSKPGSSSFASAAKLGGVGWKALDEIYKIYVLLQRSDLNISCTSKNCRKMRKKLILKKTKLIKIF